MKTQNGFTLMELLVVLLLVGLLASMVSPIVTTSIGRAEESALKENLFVLRKAIDDYYADKGHYPNELNALVEGRYIRAIPVDPITGRKDAWITVMDEQTEGETGIIDIHSGSEKSPEQGKPYNEW